jgi:hypothetical protein
LESFPSFCETRYIEWETKEKEKASPGLEKWREENPKGTEDQYWYKKWKEYELAVQRDEADVLKCSKINVAEFFLPKNFGFTKAYNLLS